jgi:hypothetical protein
MKRIARSSAWVLIMTLLLATGCTGAKDANTPFQLSVLPKELKGMSMPGQQVVFLVTVDDEGDASKVPVAISAQAAGAEVKVVFKDILEGQVAEVVVIPAAASVGKVLEVVVTGIRGTATRTEKVAFEVVEWEDSRLEMATQVREKFVGWLALKHPELKIQATTTWTGTIVSPQWLIVEHYLFFSDEWEMHVERHVMVAPDDWVRIDLRRRFKESRPSLAFEISSWDADDEPVAIDVPESAWR